MNHIIRAISIITLLLMLHACEDVQSYPPEPQIELKSYQFINTVDTFQTKVQLLTLELSFTDGDGDLFYYYSDTLSLRGKIHLNFYKKVNGIFEQVPDSFWTIPYTSQLPYSDVMQRDGQNKTQKGTISYSNYFYSSFPFDTIQVECFITDMENHQSNVVKVPKELVISK